MNKRVIGILAAAVMVGWACGKTPAATIISVPNYSFESPVVGSSGFPVSLTIDNWTTTGPANEVVDIGAGPQNSGVGIFPNPASGATHFTNADGNQLAYMFSGSTHTLFESLPTTFRAGNSYSLTVGVGNAGSPPTVGDVLQVAFFYTTSASPTTPILLSGSPNVVEGTDALSQSSLTDFTATTGLLGAANPAVTNNSPIGVIFTTTGVGGGEFDLDNVRVIATPEPGMIGITGVVGLLALLRRRRDTRCGA